MVGKLAPVGYFASGRGECVAKAGGVADAAEGGDAFAGEVFERLSFAAEVDEVTGCVGELAPGGLGSEFGNAAFEWSRAREGKPRRRG